MLCSKSTKRRRTSVASPPPLATTAEQVLNNDDIFFEILLRLPIRSLLTFKSVSKRWLSLISDPNFSHRRTIFHPPTPSGIFFPRPCPKSPAFDFVNLSANPSKPPFESLNFTDEKRGFLILQSCNGLFLCSSNNGNYSKRDYYVHNPTTNHSTKLPNLQPGTVFGLTLAFDPWRSSDYKVISVRYSDSFANTYQIEIYSSRTGRWRPIQGVFSAPFSMRFDSGVYWNGAVHWISTRDNSLYFDLYEEKLHELPMPPRVPNRLEDRRVKYFGNCGGNLHLIEARKHQETVLNVYEMQEDHSGWFVKYCVDVKAGLFPKFSVMAIVEDYIVLEFDGEIVRLKVEGGRFERLGRIENGGRTSRVLITLGFGLIDSYLFIESLACV